MLFLFIPSIRTPFEKIAEPIIAMTPSFFSFVFPIKFQVMAKQHI